MTSMDMASSSTNSTMMSMSSMMMVFFTSTSTPLYSSAWTPSNTRQYAGTCVFLIILAIIFRSLLAWKATQNQKWLQIDANRRQVTVSGKPQLRDSVARDSEAKSMQLSENGVEQDVTVVRHRRSGIRPWRISTALPRAALDTAIAGVGYLLMLAVMTLNVGYYLSILGGTFLGSLAVGHYEGH